MKFYFLLLLQLIMINASAQLNTVSSGVFHWDELPVQKDSKSEIRKITEGSTSEFSYFEINGVTQKKGYIRKSKLQPDMEELIIIKEGKMKATISDTIAVLGKGSLLLIAPAEKRTFENVGDGPLTYYELSFRSKNGLNIERNKQAGGTLILNADSLAFTKTEKGATKKYFSRPTATCDNYEMHITELAKKGPSHAPHQHVDTEIILVIDGDVAMTIDGKDYKGSAGDLFFVASGEMHGVSNASEKSCSYFAFKWR